MHRVFCLPGSGFGFPTLKKVFFLFSASSCALSCTSGVLFVCSFIDSSCICAGPPGPHPMLSAEVSVVSRDGEGLFLIRLVFFWGLNDTRREKSDYRLETGSMYRRKAAWTYIEEDPH